MSNVKKDLRHTLNEDVLRFGETLEEQPATPLDVKAVDALKTMLLRFMKSYDIEYSELGQYIKAATKTAKKQLSAHKKAANLKPDALAEWLRETVESQIESCVDDSSPWGTHWYYDDFIMEDNGYANLLQDVLNDYWSDIQEELDPKELYSDFDEYFEAQNPNKQKKIVDFVNAITFNYFKGNTDASYEDYCDD